MNEYFDEREEEELDDEVREDVKVEEEDVTLSELLDDEEETDSDTAEEDNSKDEQPELDSVSKRFKDKTKEDVIEAYKNLEKMAGDHSRELGEIRKQLKEVKEGNNNQKSGDKIDNLSLKELEDTINYIDDKIASEPLADSYKEDYLLRQKLARKREELYIKTMVNSSKSMINNEKEIASFREQFKGLPDETFEEIKEYAMTKFADEFGSISKHDLETAFFKTNKTLYEQNLKMEMEKKVRDNIVKSGKIASTPTLKASETDRKVNKIESWETIYKKDPQKAMKIADKLSPQELDKLIKKINK